MTEVLHVVCPHCDGTNRLPADRLGQAAKCGRCKQALFTGQPVALDAARFDKHLARSDLPLIVDFWAEWCGPCRAMAPVFERAAQALEPRARFIKIDVDANPDLARRFGIQGIPALFAFQGGKVAARQSGMAKVEQLQGWVDRFAPRLAA
ncbi:thioredoxin TrxC [Phenylobacterium sp.]|uniref:thioredoxin TrxC n=1 Tax=Phenylobacterium sp. TaxID=1871053 RepID=UPI002FE3918F